MSGMEIVLGLLGAGMSMAMGGSMQTPAPPPPPPPPPDPPTKESDEVQKAIDDEQRKRMAADSPADQNITKNSLSRQDPLTISTNVNRKQSLLGSAISPSDKMEG